MGTTSLLLTFSLQGEELIGLALWVFTGLPVTLVMWQIYNQLLLGLTLSFT
jgi:hypothetical protein